MTTSLIKPSRRGFVTGLGALFIAAPAIVRATSLMPVKAMSPSEGIPNLTTLHEYNNGWKFVKGEVNGYIVSAWCKPTATPEQILAWLTA